MKETRDCLANFARANVISNKYEINNEFCGDENLKRCREWRRSKGRNWPRQLRDYKRKKHN